MRGSHDNGEASREQVGPTTSTARAGVGALDDLTYFLLLAVSLAVAAAEVVGVMVPLTLTQRGALDPGFVHSLSSFGFSCGRCE